MDDDVLVRGVAHAECGAFCFDIVAVLDTNMHTESSGGLLFLDGLHYETFALTDGITEEILAAYDLVTRFTHDIFARKAEQRLCRRIPGNDSAITVHSIGWVVKVSEALVNTFEREAHVSSFSPMFAGAVYAIDTTTKPVCSR